MTEHTRAFQSADSSGGAGRRAAKKTQTGGKIASPDKKSSSLHAEEGFYVTSPLYYVNDRPHLGTAYTTLLADVFSRYHRFFGREAFFLTGTDEHGQKCAEAALSSGKSPERHCDEMSAQFQKVWGRLNIHKKKEGALSPGYNLFFRTTHKYKDHRKSHADIVRQVFSQLKKQGDIYKAVYEGWYSVSEEIFYTEKDVSDGKSPSGSELVPVKEENYFFKMSRYQERLIDFLEKTPDFVYPLYRQNELKGFLKRPLRDLCVSRPKARVSWGVELPFDSDYVAYVWVDALLNYITAVGYGSCEAQDQRDFEKWWVKTRASHFIGKDILITHGVYWPCLLTALNLPLPKKIIAHGWLLNQSGGKMSKSKGDVMDPLELSKILGPDSLRYVLCRELVLGNDALLSTDSMIQRVHQDLSDGPGNILSRLSRLTEKWFEGQIPPPSKGDEVCFGLKDSAKRAASGLRADVEMFQLSQALEKANFLIIEINRLLEKEAPWKSVRQDKQRAASVIYSSLEALRIFAVLLSPVMPEKMRRLLSLLGQNGEPSYSDALQWGKTAPGSPLIHGEPLFPKISSSA